VKFSKIDIWTRREGTIQNVYLLKYRCNRLINLVDPLLKWYLEYDMETS